MITDLSFLSLGQDWPPKSEIDRLTLYENNRRLFEGKHEQVYKNWVRLLREDQKATLEIILNWPKRLSTLWADLLFGEPPKITCGDTNSPEQQTLERLLEDNQLINIAYEVALDISRFGTGIFKIRYDGRAIIEGQPPMLWFPVVKPDNIKNITAHVLAWVWDEEQSGLFGRKKVQHLKAEIHEKGKITTAEFIVKDGKIAQEISREEQLTGIDDFLIVPVNNLLTTDRVNGLDDYSDLDSIVQELEIRFGQISRILDKHADPNMYGPDTALEIDPGTGEVVMRGGGKYFPVGEGEEPPGYVTWDGQLSAAFKEIEILLDQFYAISETSAAALGQLKQGLAESGSALRRLMMTPLAKVNRIRMRFDPAIKKVLRLASELEVAQGMAKAVKLENINIAWRDGLPEDEMEKTQIYALRIQNGLASRETALQNLYEYDTETLQRELLQITAEANAEVPMIFRPAITGGGAANA